MKTDQRPISGGPGKVQVVRVRPAWDVLQVDGTNWPGIHQVRPTMGRKLDVRESPGANGSGLSYLGYQPATAEVTTTVWGADDYEALINSLSIVQPRASQGAPRAHSLYHPALDALGLSRFFLVTVTGPEMSEGMVTVTTRWIEYRPLSRRNASAPKVQQSSRDALFTPEPLPGPTPEEIRRGQSLPGGSSEP